MSTEINKAQFMHLPQFQNKENFFSNLVRKIQQLAGLRSISNRTIKFHLYKLERLLFPPLNLQLKAWLMFRITEPLLHPLKKEYLTNLMTPLTFLLYWQWCRTREPVASGAVKFGLCMVFSYLRRKLPSFVKGGRVLEASLPLPFWTSTTSEPNVSWPGSLLTFVISALVLWWDGNFLFPITENMVAALGLRLRSVAFH